MPRIAHGLRVCGAPSVAASDGVPANTPESAMSRASTRRMWRPSNPTSPVSGAASRRRLLLARSPHRRRPNDVRQRRGGRSPGTNGARLELRSLAASIDRVTPSPRHLTRLDPHQLHRDSIARPTSGGRLVPSIHWPSPTIAVVELDAVHTVATSEFAVARRLLFDLAGRCDRLVVDFSSTRMFDGAFLGVLAATWSRMGRRRSCLVLRGLDDHGAATGAHVPSGPDLADHPDRPFVLQPPWPVVERGSTRGRRF